MHKERFAIWGITVLLLLGVGVFGLASYLESQRAQLLETTRPHEALQRYQELAERAAAPSRDVVLSNHSSSQHLSDLEDGAYNLQTMLQYGELFQEREADDTAGRMAQLTAHLNRVGVERSTPEEREELKHLFELDAEFIDRIRATARRGGLAFPLELEDGFQMLMPHLAPMRDFARRLAASARLNAADGDYDAAVEDILSAMSLAESIQQEPVLISQHVAWAIYEIAISAVQQDFEPGQLPPEFAAQIGAQAITSFDADAISDALRMEQHFMISHITDDASDRGEYIEGSSLFTRIAREVYDSPLMSPWRDWDAMTYSNLMDDFIETAQHPYYELSASLESVQQEFDSVSIFMVATRSSIPSVRSIASTRTRVQAQLDLMAIGLAIESHAAEFGVLPESLNELSIPIPDDPHTGEPYRYSRTGDGFTLYSVGANLTDDGGRHEFYTGDIVWRGEPLEEKARPTQKVAAR